MRNLAKPAGCIAGNCQMIWIMAMRDVQARYIGSVGGFFWILAKPLALVAVYYFVFAVGFKAKGPEGTPYVIWFVGGLVPWMFFAETLLPMTNSVLSNAHLVKKTLFPTESLPVVNLLSGLLPHAVFLGLLLILLIIYGIPLKFERALVLYFLLCSCTLLLGMGWMLSALQVFFRDTEHGMGIILNLWFWSTPIVWTWQQIPQAYWKYFELNPMNYIIEGYRGLLVYSDIRWPTAESTAYFWGVTITLLFVGLFVFRRLKPEFPDVM